MRGSLGEKIGEGVFADVHAWTPGQVVKLFKAGVSQRLSGHEARVTRAVFAAGGPAPDEVTLEGRFGIVLPRLDGPTLLQHYRSGAITFEQAGAILASLYLSVHTTPPPPDVLSARLYGRLVAAPRRHRSGAHRHRHPRPDRAPAAGGRFADPRFARDQHHLTFTAVGPRPVRKSSPEGAINEARTLWHLDAGSGRRPPHQ